MSTARRVTIVDVARAAGVAVSSASVALRGEPGVSAETRARVLDHAERLGYRPDQRARLLRQRRTHLLGVTFAVAQPFHAELLESLYRAVADLPYDLVLSATTPDRPITAATEALAADRCEAIILISPELSAAELAELAARLPVVAVSPGVAAPGVDIVRSDDEQGIAEAVAHVVATGHRATAYVDGGHGAVSVLRRDAYLAATRAHGILGKVLAGQPSEEAGIEAVRTLFSADRDGSIGGRRGSSDESTGAGLPTAILTHNDLVAVGVLLTLREYGVDVPGQVAVVGYDDSRTAGLATIRLTTVSQSPHDLASAAVRLAVERIEDRSLPAREVVTAPRLVVRGTTHPADGGDDDEREVEARPAR